VATQLPTLPESFREKLALDAESLFRYLVGRTPEGVTLEVHTEADPKKRFSMAASPTGDHTILVDPVALYLDALAVVQGKKPGTFPNLSDGFVNENLIFAHAEAIMNSHELGHVAGFDALTDEEVAVVASQLKQSDYERVIEEYYPTEDDKKLALSKLADTTNKDPNTGLPVAEAAKRGLSEEWLRQWLERTTLGYTQEEMADFFRGNPSGLRIAGKYLAGVFRAMVNRMSFRKNYNSTLHAYVNRMSAEMRLLRAGYRLGSPVAGFDANNPGATLELMKLMLGSSNVREEDLPGGVQGDVLRAPSLPSGASPSSLRHAALEAKHNAGTITPAEIEEASRLVEERALEKGYVVKAYHGTNANA
jgi:hypothetical protein